MIWERKKREAGQRVQGQILSGLISRGVESVLHPDGSGELQQCSPSTRVFICAVRLDCRGVEESSWEMTEV